PSFLTSTLLYLSHLFSFTYPAPPAIYTLSLHDALPISGPRGLLLGPAAGLSAFGCPRNPAAGELRHCAAHGGQDLLGDTHHGGRDRKSTRLNSSHLGISYAVFCLKKKKKTKKK